MKAWQFHASGDINSLRLDDAPNPEPQPHEALIQLEYAALNPADRYLILGQYPRSSPPPFTVGRDGCGVVVTPGNSGCYAKGDRVVVLGGNTGVSSQGTLAQMVCVPEEWLAPLPEGWTAQEGAAAPLVHLTAWQALVDRGNLQGEENVLITGASGGVGTAALAIAKSFGAHVIVLSRSPEKRARLCAMGADHAIDTCAEDLDQQMKASLHGGKLDLVLDNLGGPFLARCVKMAGYGARIMVVGLLAGLTSEITLGLLIHKCIQIQGLSVSSYTPAQAKHAWQRIVFSLHNHSLRPLIDQEFGFDSAPAAFECLSQGPLGKVLVRNNLLDT